MVNITKVYTKTGDDGTTGLAGNQRVSKDSLRIDTIGEVDEVNCVIGLAAQAMAGHLELKELHMQCLKIQHLLFNLGSQLCVLFKDRRSNTPVITKEDTIILEQKIDEMNQSLPKLTSFILPGGGQAAVYLHLARATCRRAERSLVSLSHTESLDGTEQPFLNRLSDWLFVAARYAAYLQGEKELLWVSAS